MIPSGPSHMSGVFTELKIEAMVCRKMAGIRDQVLRERRPFSLAWSQHFPHNHQLTGRRGVWSMALFCLFLLVRCFALFFIGLSATCNECLDMFWISGPDMRHDAENGIFLNVMSVRPAFDSCWNTKETCQIAFKTGTQSIPLLAGKRIFIRAEFRGRG